MCARRCVSPSSRASRGSLRPATLDAAPSWRYGIRGRRGNVSRCRLATHHTATRRSAESSVDDFDTYRGDVLIRAVSILRYIESQPSIGRFVNCVSIHTFDHSIIFFSHLPTDVMNRSTAIRSAKSAKSQTYADRLLCQCLLCNIHW